MQIAILAVAIVGALLVFIAGGHLNRSANAIEAQNKHYKIGDDEPDDEPITGCPEPGGLPKATRG